MLTWCVVAYICGALLRAFSSYRLVKGGSDERS